MFLITSLHYAGKLTDCMEPQFKNLYCCAFKEQERLLTLRLMLSLLNITMKLWTPSVTNLGTLFLS